MVIPNLNGATWLEGCLGSLRESTLPDLELVIADDGSTDASADVTARFGGRFVPGGNAPSGFARTANRGIRAATGERILLLNNDTVVPPDTVALLLETAERTGAGIVSPLVVSMRDPDRIDSIGLFIFRDGTARPGLHGEGIAAAPAAPRPILLPSGTAMLVERRVFDRIGLFDESFESYAEDLDWGLRAARAGEWCLLQPTARVHHWFSGTTAGLSPYKARCIERNHVTVAVRHLPLSDVVLLPVWTVARWMALRSSALDASPEPGERRRLISAVLRGTAEGVLRIPGAIAGRRRLARRYPVERRDWTARLRNARCTLDDFRHFGS